MACFNGEGCYQDKRQVAASHERVAASLELDDGCLHALVVAALSDEFPPRLRGAHIRHGRDRT
jgi:hypothetical protein